MLTPSLEKLRNEIEGYAREYGLDFFPTIFEMIDYKLISEVAAYGGFPTRYPHWRFGMEFDGLNKGFIFGGSRIYEMVINNDPCYAYLLSSNPEFDQKTVMAHVFAHCDFFKNNMWFANTNRKMMDEMANHAARIRRYIDKYGIDKVEDFLDVALSLENLIDPYEAVTPPKKADQSEKSEAEKAKEKKKNVDDDDYEPAVEIPRLKVDKKYMEKYINPEDYVHMQKEKAEVEKKIVEKRFPPRPVRDVLTFLIEHAPLKNWQRDILSIIQEEAYYFAPQWMTKILNEGWATYWHSTIMTQKAMTDSELIGYAAHHSGVVATGGGGLNPYKIGLELLRDVEDRWNKGRFGKEYEECDSMHEKLHWDKKLGLGRQKIFEIRKFYNDINFIDEFLTAEFCDEHKLFTFGYNRPRERWEIMSREFEDIKQQLLRNLTNGGNPFIYVIDGNYMNRGELMLQHKFEGVELQLDHARATLKNLQTVWDRPVNLLTVAGEKPVIMRYDGKQWSQRELALANENEESPKEENKLVKTP